MSDLLAAARAALPGAVVLAATGVDVELEIAGIYFAAGPDDDGDVWCSAGEDEGDSGPFTVDEAAQWLRAQVEARRDALTAALGDGWPYTDR